MSIMQKASLGKAPAAAYNALFSAPMPTDRGACDRAAGAICSSLFIRQVGKQVADQAGAWYGTGIGKQVADQ